MRKREELIKLATKLVNSSYEEIEKAARKHNISPLMLFLTINDMYIKKYRPDVWADIEALLEEEENYEEDI